jgi:multidrug resistance efflux pump
MKEIKGIVEREAAGTPFRAFNSVYAAGNPGRIRRWTIGILLVLLAIMFLPWTQNIRARGTVTTLRQEQRPQEVNPIIGGRIVKWWVKEGDLVQAGDTIAQLAEVKDAYLDPELLSRTEQQLAAKEASIDFYGTKVRATDRQMAALQEGARLKVQQIENKIAQLERKLEADRAEAVAAANDLKIAEAQYTRQRAMRDSGLVSLAQLEQRNAAYQTAMAKRTSADAKYLNTQTDLTNARVEMSSVQQDMLEKQSKAAGERAAAQSDIATGQGEVAKLSNQYTNYRIRSGMYFVLAPQAGQITKARKAGVGEIVKEGEMLVEIVPKHLDHAVELFVKPLDLPLISPGQRVMFLFDGFPALVFSGWPSASSGTFRGRVVAVENSVSPNGLFRILVAEDSTYKPWPDALRIGTGAQGMALCKDVPIWYELWRNINGFPPDYYKPAAAKEDDKTKG